MRSSSTLSTIIFQGDTLDGLTVVIGLRVFKDLGGNDHSLSVNDASYGLLHELGEKIWGESEYVRNFMDHSVNPLSGILILHISSKIMHVDGNNTDGRTSIGKSIIVLSTWHSISNVVILISIFGIDIESHISIRDTLGDIRFGDSCLTTLFSFIWWVDLQGGGQTLHVEGLGEVSEGSGNKSLDEEVTKFLFNIQILEIWVVNTESHGLQGVWSGSLEEEILVKRI